MADNNNPEIRDTRIYLCLDCGKCTVVCPIARYNFEFNPRLIVQRNAGPKRPDIQDETIWSCLNCYMCLERCNYRVEFPEFIRILRTEALTRGASIQCSHGGALQTLMHLMAKESQHQERLRWLPPDIELSGDYNTIFFVGCAPYFDTIFSSLGINTLEGVKGVLRLLNRAHIPFNIMADERCCGRDLLLQGDKDGFMALARANTDEFTRLGVKKVITICPECYYSLKVDYPRMLGSVAIEVAYWTDVIAPLLQSDELCLGRLEEKVTYHDPCALGRGSRIFDTPRQVLCAMDGLELIEIEQCREKALCCGGSSWVHCGAANRQIQEELLAQAEATGARVLATSCPKCQIHLKCAQQCGNGNTSKIDIQDLASLVTQSLYREVS
jgi:heterodisulfide reductase subunit D